MGYREAGFTLIELIAIMVIIGIIAVTASSRFASTDLARLQA
ncbi:MAG TPA: prepilin-type N-terminal cleavage/methylation domain-containing protein, partial [Cellvibrionaceae bacterium]